MSEMVDKMFSQTLAEQMPVFYGQKKMFDKFNKKSEQKSQRKQKEGLNNLVNSYQNKVAASEDRLFDAMGCDEDGYGCDHRVNDYAPRYENAMVEDFDEAFEDYGDEYDDEYGEEYDDWHEDEYDDEWSDEDWGNDNEGSWNHQQQDHQT